MRMTTRSPPIMTNPFSFPEFDSSFFQTSFASPPAPASGPSLLDDQETSAFAEFLDKVGSEQDASFFFDSKVLFDPKLPDPMMWGWHDDTTRDYPYQPSTALNANLNSVTTPLSSERSTFALKQEGNDPRSGSISIAPNEIALDPFSALHSSPRASSTSERPQLQGHGLQWGSDPNFGFTGYTNSTGKEHSTKEDMLAQRAMAMLVKGGESLNTTAGNTTVNSPAEVRNYPSVKGNDEDGLVSPSKRRKSFHRKTSEEDDEQDSSSESPKPKSKTKSSKKDLQSPNTKLSKKKKKAMQSRKENLTEAQKRENHIQSEQKRRNLIREGFDDLCGLVPELRGGGYSKSAILVHAANFLEQLEEGNKVLQVRVKQLGGAA